MIHTAIIGAGQLGSRHLQGLLKSKNIFTVHMVDPSEESLKLSEGRAAEIEHEHPVYFHSDVSNLPEKLEFVVIATNADVRFKVLEKLVNHCQVSTLILEKVLFQKKSDFQKALELIEENGINCYVNHPRRMQQIYQDLRKVLSDDNNESYDVDMYGTNWGLGCNGLHLSDVIEFVLDDKINSYYTQEIDLEVVESKRNGFYDFTGTIVGKTEKGHNFRITSKKSENGHISAVSATFNSSLKRVWLSEGGGMPAYTIEIMNNSAERVSVNGEPFKFQSDLTGVLLDTSFEGKELPLTTYKDAMNNHLNFISALLDHLYKVTNEKTEVCPIT